jgi:hypothetical protein
MIEVTHADDNKDNDEGHGRQYCTLEPQLAIFEVEAHLDQIAHELRLSAELFADHCSSGWLECAIDTEESEE